ncbi:odorant receptor 67d-like [Cochliomyia hominivorax]
MSTNKYSQQFRKIFSVTRFLSELCGADIIKDDYRVTLKTGMVIVIINLALIFIFYCNYIEVIGNGDWTMLLKSTSVIGIGVQGYIKLVNAVTQRNNFIFLYNTINDMYETYEQRELPYKNCLRDNLSLVKKLLTFIAVIVLITSITVTLLPVYMLIFYQKKVDILPFYLPYLDNTTEFGFYCTFAFQATCVILGGYGNSAVDTWLFIYAAHVPMMKNIMKCKFDDLDVVLEEHPRCMEKSKDFLKDILQWHQKYIHFCEILKETFFWVIFVQLGSETWGIISTIVCMFMGIWTPAPIFLFYLFVIFYTYCSLGNIVEVANDDVTNMIYDCNWYNLTVPEQKMILIMLRESQQAAGMSIGGVAPLSLNTALQITKTIYTMSMMLDRYFN